MTLLATYPSDSSVQRQTSPATAASTVKATAMPRFNLRKRSATFGEREVTHLATVNSAFLTGIFADVANAHTESTENSTYPLAIHHLDDPQPVKKARKTMNKTMSRCGRSYKTLTQALEIVSPPSPTGICDAPNGTYFEQESVQRNDSLHYQLNCVSRCMNDNSSVKTVLNAGELIFPYLPATISNSSCSSSLTRKISDLQSSVSENVQKESYGWFVEMDKDGDQDCFQTVDSYASTASLAFLAPTAPKALNHDAEVEWAKAADTVDDVLGDFF
ncbi:predicted protein [Phaeodactylum tricornutum CCAP 1055/1]|jgi:hypothetical protein|uniref:Uncharacterized protein n=1 Tax=Phaeodactylum tricornutum (strain CCAP 1055/1) TaxID=556484 RepID=B7FTW6_PHATC|nr:predicted protein [Phaeodactylum tricornutum CCAP 1055/1]EEC50157.1 predicted protein [Phaeodactylum tricornutum CCAP 1055/1]|mmetsp:Transcript_59058/g.157982  ORF Transcript_59058/g.157982 Transcript_59058/m.157982 type:complete len:274 (+) Transcript_59058:157-978(+)|eukprot:XP_002178492.1 predicted protein [Phaeodactylum tricornutum CCAP 1055/1]